MLGTLHGREEIVLGRESTDQACMWSRLFVFMLVRNQSATAARRKSSRVCRTPREDCQSIEDPVLVHVGAEEDLGVP